MQGGIPHDILYSGKVWQTWRIVRDLPNQISIYSNNLLADLLIRLTFFRQMLEKSQFAKLSSYTVQTIWNTITQ